MWQFCTFTLRKICRGVLFGAAITVAIITLSTIKDSDGFKRISESSVMVLKQEDTKIVVQELDGRKVFQIEGLPTGSVDFDRFLPLRLSENLGFHECLQISLATLPAKIKTKLAKKVAETYRKRKKVLLKSCGRSKYHRWAPGMQLIAVPDKELTVCVVQKAGSSSWHHIVYDLREPNGTWNGLCHQLNRKHGQKLPDHEKEKLMKSNSGLRVITVRHPFARLISGWNNKMHKNHLLDSTKILATLKGIEEYIHRSNPDQDHIIAFKDFAQYLVDKGLKDVDIHFQPIERLCQPCRFPYDYVTKAETSQQNLWWLLDRVGAVMPTFTKHAATGSGENATDIAKDPWQLEKRVMTAFFKKMPFETVVKLKELYRLDFERFGYTFDLNTMTAGDIID